MILVDKNVTHYTWLYTEYAYMKLFISISKVKFLYGTLKNHIDSEISAKMSRKLKVSKVVYFKLILFLMKNIKIYGPNIYISNFQTTTDTVIYHS